MMAIKQYCHDYTKPAEADDALYRALRLLANECYDAAQERIGEARKLLQEYLNQENVVEDDDVENGWVRFSDACQIFKKQRKEIRHYVDTQKTMNKTTLAIVERAEESIQTIVSLRAENARLKDRVGELEKIVREAGLID